MNDVQFEELLASVKDMGKHMRGMKLLAPLFVNSLSRTSNRSVSAQGCRRRDLPS